jgi:hypothetical protein
MDGKAIESSTLNVQHWGSITELSLRSNFEQKIDQINIIVTCQHRQFNKKQMNIIAKTSQYW